MQRPGHKLNGMSFKVFDSMMGDVLTPLVTVQKPKNKLYVNRNQSMYTHHNEFDIKTFRRLNLFES